MNISYIILKHVIWRFQIYNLFREIVKFREDKAIMYFAKFLNAFVKPRNLNFSRNKLYIWHLQITRFKMIYNMFVFEIFQTSKNGLNSDYFEKNAHKIAKSKYFPDILNDSDFQINSLSDDI